MKPPVPLSRTPASLASPALEPAVRVITAPPGIGPGRVLNDQQLQPGETFVNGARLGYLELSPEADFLYRLIERITAVFQPPRGEGDIVAPEDGLLTWIIPKDDLVVAYKPLVNYIPLAAWREFESVLQEHDRLFRKNPAHILPPDPYHFPAPDDTGGPLSPLFDALISRVGLLTSRRMSVNWYTELLAFAGHMRAAIGAACPVAPEDIAPLFYRYFCAIQSLDERFQAVDEHYAPLWYAAAHTAPEGTPDESAVAAGDDAPTSGPHPERHDPDTNAHGLRDWMEGSEADKLIRTWIDAKEQVLRHLTAERGNVKEEAER